MSKQRRNQLQARLSIQVLALHQQPLVLAALASGLYLLQQACKAHKQARFRPMRGICQGEGMPR